MNDLDSGMNPFQFQESPLGVINAILGARLPSDSSEMPIQHGDGCVSSCIDKNGFLDTGCYNKCMSQSSEALPSYSSKPTFSEKLEDIASNLLAESTQLSSMAGSLELMGI